MTNVQLHKIIEKFDENDLKIKGIFGIFQYGGGSDESFIKANKEGLELFALELLKSANSTEEVLNDSEKTIIPFQHNEDWIDENSNTIIEYIEPLYYNRKINVQKDYKTKNIEKLISLGFGFLGIILVISVLVGFATIIKWMF
ncbi:hypothetical protein [Flavobacterium algicola]|uniref:hypothetical protein n=1 Tax=Flavobacterium algicola TaxID=556529 RepID=UPI001EFE33BA|nr:hypothetical protein [Flavobacterium algicola]MCG9793267.1 hypothetical protein [Flavobacterium algicola]